MGGGKEKREDFRGRFREDDEKPSFNGRSRDGRRGLKERRGRERQYI